MNTQNIKEFLIDTEILSSEQVEEIQDKIFADGKDNDENFLETALELNLIKSEVAQEILSLVLSIPRIDLNKKAIDLETFSVLPEPIARERKAIVFEKKGDQISLAVSNFESLDEFKEVLSEFNIDYFLSDVVDINKKIMQYQNLLRDTWGSALFSSLNSIPKIRDFAFREYEDIRPEYLTEITDNYHSEKFINSLLEYALKSQAEFIYFDCEEEGYGVYLRIFSQRYKIMEISTETTVSLFLKLKKYADLNIQDKKTIQEGSFGAELNGENHDIFLSFVQTNVGISVTIQLDKKIVFPIPFSKIGPQQQEIYFTNARKASGLILLSPSVYSFVSLAEMESKKNKEIYSITEKPVEYKIPTVNHISLRKGEKKTLLVSQILKNRPDVLFLDSITKSLIPILMNFVTSGKKVYLELEQDFSVFVENLIKSGFTKNKIIKNLSYSITHQEFNKLNPNNRKSYKLTSVEKKKIQYYLPNIDFKKCVFYTKKKNKLLSENSEKITMRGIFDIAEILEKAFSKKTKGDKLKNESQKIAKKSILENIISQKITEQIDIKDILRYLK